MACFHPIEAHRNTAGEIVFSPAAVVTDHALKLACGQCIGCRLERSRQWAVRIMHESEMHEKNSFITLTYDDAHLPASQSLDHSHIQKFLKRWRRQLGVGETLRYYQCGEYGDENGRQHHHMATFGQDLVEDRIHVKTTIHGNKLYQSPTLAKLWPYGLHWIGDLTFESAAYVARYVTKKITGERAADHYATQVDLDTGEIHSQKPPYSTMSRNPGLGQAWLKQFTSDVYPSDEVIVNGKKCLPPKYYDDQYEKLNKKSMLKIKHTRQKNGNKHKHNNTPDRLAVREECMIARTSELKRTL